ncbi:hypothetical protein CVT24_005587, partial [Panaeolus cyanescens]
SALDSTLPKKITAANVTSWSLLETIDNPSEAGGDIWEQLQVEGKISKANETKGALKLLCTKEEEQQKEHISILIHFEDRLVCNHLLQHKYISVLGTQCQLLRYRGPKKKTQTQQTRPTSPSQH